MCAITGVPSDTIPLKVVPEWRFDAVSKRVSLAGTAAVCEPLARVKQFDQLKNAEERTAALQLMLAIQGWQVKDLERYLSFVDRRRNQMGQEGSGWQLDLSWAHQ